jgi:hypothetical protein
MQQRNINTVKKHTQTLLAVRQQGVWSKSKYCENYECIIVLYGEFRIKYSKQSNCFLKSDKFKITELSNDVKVR